MSQVISLRLRQEQVERTRRVARRLNRTVSETAALLLEEALRVEEFALIQFRSSPAGRQAYIQGSSLAVWEVMLIAAAYDHDAERAAEHLCLSPEKVRAAINYARAFPEEIRTAMEDNAMSFEELRRMVPGAVEFKAPSISQPDEGDSR